jgi:hypothetical protein
MNQPPEIEQMIDSIYFHSPSKVIEISEVRGFVVVEFEDGDMVWEEEYDYNIFMADWAKGKIYIAGTCSKPLPYERLVSVYYRMIEG